MSENPDGSCALRYGYSFLYILIITKKLGNFAVNYLKAATENEVDVNAKT